MPLVWVDVEEVRGFPGTPRIEENNALLDGVVAGYAEAGLGVGLYSLASQ